MSSQSKRLGWLELLLGLVFSPRHTAWEFANCPDTHKRSWQLVVFSSLFALSCGVLTYVHLHNTYPIVLQETLEFDLVFEIINALATITLFPIAIWVFAIVIQADGEVEKNKVPGVVASQAGVSAILYPLYFSSLIFIAQAATEADDPLSTYNHWELVSVLCLVATSFLLSALYIDGVFLKGFWNSVGRLILFIVGIIPFYLIFTSLILYFVYLMTGEFSWL